MSGGSYDYLCFKDADEMMNYTYQLQQMADRLAGLEYANDAAKETQQLLLTIRQYENRISASLERLKSVWQSIEWWDSGDSGEAIVKQALEEYRGA